MSDVTPQTSPETLPSPSVDETDATGEATSSEAGPETSPDSPDSPDTRPDTSEGPGSKARAEGQAAGQAEAGPEPSADHDTAGRPSRLRQLEREGEIAADFLETLLDIADLDGDLDVDVDGDRAAVAIVDSEEGRVPRRLVGDNGRVLDALQELTRLAVQVETGERSRLMLDVAGYRADRRATLVALAREAVAAVQASGVKKELEPMTAFERKIVHDVVAAAGLVSESDGLDPNRHVVILPT